MNIMRKFKYIFSLGVSFIIQSIAFYLALYVASGMITRNLLYVLITCYIILSIGLLYAILLVDDYINKVIIVKHPYEPLIMATLIVTSLFLPVYYYILKRIMVHFMNNVLAIYLIPSLVALIIIFTIFYILSS